MHGSIYSHVVHHSCVLCPHHKVTNDTRVISHLCSQALTHLVHIINLLQDGSQFRYLVRKLNH